MAELYGFITANAIQSMGCFAVFLIMQPRAYSTLLYSVGLGGLPAAQQRDTSYDMRQQPSVTTANNSEQLSGGANMNNNSPSASASEAVAFFNVDLTDDSILFERIMSNQSLQHVVSPAFGTRLDDSLLYTSNSY